MFAEILRYLSLLVGLSILAVGLVTFPLPIPLGLPLILIGSTILIANSQTARGLFAWLRWRYPGF